ncbi:MAG TPA: glycosyltransferase [Vicinamibacterales bacterium]
MTEPLQERRLRVLRVIARLNIGGPARHVVLLDQGLAAHGWDTRLIFGSSGPAEGSLQSLVEAQQLPFTYVPSLGRRIHVSDDLAAFWQVLQAFRRWAPDVVHTHTAKAGALGRCAGIVYNLTRRRRKRCALVHTFHGHVFEGYFGTAGSAAVRVVERILGTVTDTVVVISDRQRRDVVDRFHIAPAARVRVIPLGLDLAPLLDPVDRQAARQAIGVSPAEVVVGYVGRLVPIKRVGLLIEACALARRRLPALTLVIAGDGDERAGLEALVRERGMEGNVKFLGWRSDLRGLYGAMDVFALTSANEGTPVALIEALAAGVPAVAAAVGGVPDVVGEGGGVDLIDSSDPAAFAEAIVRIASSRSEASAASRRAIVQRFGADRLAADVSRAYDDALSSRRGPRDSPRSW